MQPKYMLENTYTIYPKLVTASVVKSYQVETPESSFEWKVFSLFHQGKKHLYHEEFSLALDSFRELMHLIFNTVHPTLPPDPNANPYSVLPLLPGLLDPMLKRTAEILRDTPVDRYTFRATIVDKNKKLAANLAAKIDKVTGAGLQVASHHGQITEQILQDNRTYVGEFRCPSCDTNYPVNPVEQLPIGRARTEFDPFDV